MSSHNRKRKGEYKDDSNRAEKKEREEQVDGGAFLKEIINYPELYHEIITYLPGLTFNNYTYGPRPPRTSGERPYNDRTPQRSEKRYYNDLIEASDGIRRMFRRWETDPGSYKNTPRQRLNVYWFFKKLVKHMHEFPPYPGQEDTSEEEDSEEEEEEKEKEQNEEEKEETEEEKKLRELRELREIVRLEYHYISDGIAHMVNRVIYYAISDSYERAQLYDGMDIYTSMDILNIMAEFMHRRGLRVSTTVAPAVIEIVDWFQNVNLTYSTAFASECGISPKRAFRLGRGDVAKYIMGIDRPTVQQVHFVSFLSPEEGENPDFKLYHKWFDDIMTDEDHLYFQDKENMKRQQMICHKYIEEDMGLPGFLRAREDEAYVRNTFRYSYREMMEPVIKGVVAFKKLSNPKKSDADIRKKALDYLHHCIRPLTRDNYMARTKMTTLYDQFIT